MGIIISLCVAVVVAMIGVGVFLKSRNWSSSEGLVLQSELDETYFSPNSARGQYGSLRDYKVTLQYEYRVDGQRYVGSDIYAALPNVFSDKSAAEQMLSEYPAGSAVIVYYNPSDPRQAALVTSASVNVKGLVVLVLLFLFVAAFVGGGFYLFSKM